VRHTAACAGSFAFAAMDTGVCSWPLATVLPASSNCRTRAARSGTPSSTIDALLAMCRRCPGCLCHTLMRWWDGSCWCGEQRWTVRASSSTRSFDSLTGSAMQGDVGCIRVGDGVPALSLRCARMCDQVYDVVRREVVSMHVDSASIASDRAEH
jgi:hypothetical protein